jgi:Fe-S-cluster containining protein
VRRALPLLRPAPFAERLLDGAEHLAFACNACGDCCRKHRVALTHRDLARLVGALGVPAPSLVAWLAPAEVELDAESAGMVALPGGPRLMVLAHDAGACRLLDATERCRAYDARPHDCRMYPFVLERSDGGETRLSLFEPAGCGERREIPLAWRDVDEGDRVRWAEVAEYRRHVARWNQLARHRERLRHRAQGELEFLAFLAARASP